MNQPALTDNQHENLITAVYVGLVFVLVALIYFINISKNLWGSFINFLNSFVLTQVPGTSISLPAPADPAAYGVLYNPVFQFFLGLGILEIGILALRIVLNSPLPRKAETIENIVFAFGTSYLITTYLVKMTIMSEWFVFWAGIILIAGLAFLARAFVLMAAGQR